MSSEDTLNHEVPSYPHLMRAVHRWLVPYLRRSLPTRPKGTRVFLSIADHFEPYHHTNHEGAMERMKRWCSEYPASISRFQDSGGRSPRHTFFYPIEQYNEEVLEHLAELCRVSGSEAEVHLHHDGDTEEKLRERLRLGIPQMQSHGMLSRSPDGRAAFAFVHGDWALANCHPEGKNCGVPHEIAVLREHGCYADFTFPSAPSPTQPSRLNSIHYVEETGSPDTLSRGVAARAGHVPAETSSTRHLLMIQGVLALNWTRRKWGLLPRLENSDLTRANPPTPGRFHLWLRHAPSVQGRPDWAFVKLHSHGAVPANSDTLLGPAMREFHEYLCNEWRRHEGGHIHYVTAREMVNVIHALEAGETEFRPELLDFTYPPPETAAGAARPATSA